MTTDPADALREQAREWGRALLAGSPWSDVSDRVTLLLVDPPAKFEGTTSVTYWLTLDLAAARRLAEPYGPALSSERAVVEHPRADGLKVTLVVMSDEALHRYLQGTTPAAIEGRWQARHHEAICDAASSTRSAPTSCRTTPRSASSARSSSNSSRRSARSARWRPTLPMPSPPPARPAPPPAASPASTKAAPTRPPSTSAPWPPTRASAVVSSPGSTT